MGKLTSTLLALCLTTSAFAQQAPSTVTNMPFASTPLDGSELLYLVQKGNPRKTNVGTILGGILGSIFTTPFLAVGNGATTATAPAQRAGETLDVKADFGAYFDARFLSAVTSATSGSAALNVVGATFVADDKGKHIVVDNAGPLTTLGVLTSIPVTASGSGYTANPDVVLSGLGASVGAKAVSNLKLLSATLLTGGAGCTNLTQIFVPFGNPIGTAATITGTVSGGALTGALTVTGGSYWPSSVNVGVISPASIPINGAGCSAAPTITTSWGVDTINVVGRGENVPLAGVTATVSTGSATLGTPVVAQTLTPLSTTISAVVDPQNVTLAVAASTTIAAVATSIVYGHDDGPAFALAKTAADTMFASGTQPTIQMPFGMAMISTAIPTFYKTIARFRGRGAGETVLFMDPALTSPMISTSENWIGTNFVSAPNIWPGNNGYAPAFTDFGVYGDRNSPNDQVAFEFYDRTDRVNMTNINGATIHGSLFQIGNLLNSTLGYMRESYFANIWCAYCGSQNNPVFDIGLTSIQGADSTNNNEFNDLMAWDVDGNCISIHSTMPKIGKAISGLNFHGGRCEGGLTYNAADLVKIGNSGAAYTGPIFNTSFFGLRLQAIPLGGNGVKFESASGGGVPSGINWYGLSTQGNGNAINIQAGYNISIEASLLSNQNYRLIVGPTPAVTAPIYMNYHGTEIGLSNQIDSTSAPFVYWPIFRTGAPDLTNSSVVANAHDGTNLGGAALPANAVDLQIGRTSSSQISAATGSTIVGGIRNAINVSGQNSTINGGADNSLNGRYSRAAGHYCNDFSRGSFDCYGGNGIFNTSGSIQSFQTVLGAAIASTTPTRLTVDGLAAASTNTMNLVSPGVASFSLLIQCRDTSNSDYASWASAAGVLSKGSGNAAYVGAYSSATAPTQSVGAGATTSLIVAADTTNQGLSVLVTMPNANIWRCSAFLNGGETR